MIKFKPLKGTKDILPEEMIFRQKILSIIKNTFEIFGFRPLETPAIEAWEVLSAKGAGGTEILKETYSFLDKGKRKIGLRYDLTVPLARFIANNPNLPLPFKRYQIEKVWRYGEIKKGRLREFLQCDIDIIGSKSMAADAEIIACAISVLLNLGLKEFIVRLNDRKILSGIMKYAEVRDEKIMDTLRTIDKLEKIGVEKVKSELRKLGLREKSIGKIFEIIKMQGPNVLEKIEELLKNSKEGLEGINELKELLSYLRKMGIEEKFLNVDLSLARGLDYYTGPIFEISAEKEIGSIAGGGRYDNLIGIFAKKEIPATGISFGIERIIEVMKERKMIKEELNKKTLIANVSDDVVDEAMKVAMELRKNNIPCEFDLMKRNLKKQLEYANSLKIKYVIILGKEEIRKGLLKLRDMESGIEKMLSLNEIISLLKTY